MDDWVVYIVECCDKSLYTGITNNIQKRIEKHNKGTGAKYTRARRPVTLRIHSKKMSKSNAMKLERKIKKKRKDDKIAYLIKHQTPPNGGI